MNYYVYPSYYSMIYPYQSLYCGYRNVYYTNFYYSNFYPFYFDYRFHPTSIYPINKTNYVSEIDYYFNRSPGDVILWRNLASGGYWRLINHGNDIVSLQNTANTEYKDWYLDIDPNTKKVILWRNLASGGYWRLINHGNGIVSLQNTANTEYKDWYLDIDPNTGNVILWRNLASGGYWRLINHGNGIVSLQNTANTEYKDWYLDIDASPTSVPESSSTQFPIKGFQKDKLETGFHMETELKLSENGKLTVHTTAESTNDIKGFTGHTYVELYDKTGKNVVWEIPDNIKVGVNAKTFGGNKKTVRYSTTISQDDVKKVYHYGIKHSLHPVNRITDEDKKHLIKTFEKLIESGAAGAATGGA
ncbi:TPA: hypothetical protein QCY06_005115 [Bacillus tropicus]|nr:hypothetical protein [Bacillus tropicus]